MSIKVIFLNIGSLKTIIMEEIDKKDTLILYELSKNSRLSLSKIAKVVGLPKATVSYRIDQLTNKGILNKNYAIINMARFSFLFYEVGVKLQGMPAEKEEQAFEILRKQPYVGWLVSTSGRFSFVCSIFVKQSPQFYETYSLIKSLFYPYIREMVLTVTFDGRQYGYPFFKKFSKRTMSMKDSSTDLPAANISEKQLKILEFLSEDSRIATTEIAHNLKIAEKTVRNNIRWLENNKFILNYTSQIHPGRAGYFFYLVTLRINKNREEVEKFLEKIPEIFYIVRGSGFYDLKAEFYVKTENRIYEIEEQLHNKFGWAISEIDIMQIKKEYLVRYFTSS